jgi:hypothetical protein
MHDTISAANAGVEGWSDGAGLAMLMCEQLTRPQPVYVV